jgi:uncharacterized NAD(P)/FAD-binding protein YdhS
MPADTSVAIIGLGSRGVGVLERLVSLCRLGRVQGPLRVDLIDPVGDGAGVHRGGQPDYLMLNTTCGQVSMFPDAATVGADVDQPGPTLYDWVTERGLRLGADGYTVSDQGRPIRPEDFLPRRLLGDYLGWCLQELTRRAEGAVEIRLHRDEAIDITDSSDGGLVIALAGGGEVHCRFAFLTTGYTDNEPVDPTLRRPNHIDRPYPLPEQLDAIRPGQTAAIQGFGLSAMDAMSSLTVGRGGRFVGPLDNLRYEPSGQEPVMVFFSRSGVPCRARPLVMVFDPKYQPIAFTESRIDQLRAQRGGPLDFATDLMPLIHAEMAISYHRRRARRRGDAVEAELVQRLRSASPDQQTVMLAELHQADPFDAAGILRGDTDMQLDSGDAYQKWIVDVIGRDLAESLLGFAGSPLKGAIDVLRDLRDTFRYAVDFDGVTDESLEHFHRYVVPQVNRAVVSPQFERHSELTALISAGLARTPVGPAPTVSWDDDTRQWTLTSTRLTEPQTVTADWLVDAFVTLPSAAASASRLIAALHRRGWIRSRLPGSRYVLGLDIDRDQHPIREDGAVEPRIWVLGPLCEGSTFYNNLVPSPGAYSRPAYDSHRCADAVLSAVTALGRS